MPPADLLKPILTAYFTHVHPWIPMVHQGRSFERLADELQREQLLIVTYSMVLAASKYVPGGAIYVRTQTRNGIVCNALGSLSLKNLQALIILPFNDFGDGNAEKAWSIIGSMTRTVEYTQLAQGQEEGDQRPFSQLSRLCTMQSTGRMWRRVSYSLMEENHGSIVCDVCSCEVGVHKWDLSGKVRIRFPLLRK